MLLPNAMDVKNTCASSRNVILYGRNGLEALLSTESLVQNTHVTLFHSMYLWRLDSYDGLICISVNLNYDGL